MNANELRIGNLLQSPKGKPFEVLAHDIVFVDGGESLAEPIPITEEWLINVGFQKSKVVGSLYLEAKISGEYSLYFNKGIISIEAEYCTEIELDHIKHVHQLQNLYFALTGKELTL